MHRTISHLPTVQRAGTESVLNIYKKPSKDYKSKSVTIQNAYNNTIAFRKSTNRNLSLLYRKVTDTWYIVDSF